MTSSKKYLIDLAIRLGSDQISAAEMALIFLAGAGAASLTLMIIGILMAIA